MDSQRTLVCPYCGQRVAVNDTDTAVAHWSNGELCKGAGKRLKR